MQHLKPDEPASLKYWALIVWPAFLAACLLAGRAGFCSRRPG